MRELSAQLELENETSLQLAAANQQLRGLVAPLLPHRLPTAGMAPTAAALSGEQREQRAQEETGQKQHLGPLLQTQAATQARREEICTTEASWRKLLEQKASALESELDRAQQENSALQLACIQAKLKSSEKRYLVGQENRRSLTKTLKKANEKLAEAGAKSPQKLRRRRFRGKAKSLGQTRAQSGNPSSSDETASAGDSPCTSPAPR
ncbi:centrobin [Opisthocomus hoazin]|uniref:centrobin n=1 Tax=Opisthocomus hoazin TaxID=30419 RepID=UPI003F52EDC3